MPKSKNLYSAICPICSKTHSISLVDGERKYQYTGRGTPRINCSNCKYEITQRRAEHKTRGGQNKEKPIRKSRGVSISDWLVYQHSLEVEFRMSAN